MPPPGFGGGFGGGLGPLGDLIGVIATGAAIASVFHPPPRRYPPPQDGYIYVTSSPGETPRAVRAEEVSFLIKRVQITAHRQGSGREIYYEVQVTMNDDYKYVVLRRYSQFDQLRERVAEMVRVVSSPFPPKLGFRASFGGLSPADIENRKVTLQAWLQTLCTAASRSNPALRVPIYDFLETALYYPPDPNATSETTGASSSIPYATATPYTETVAEASVVDRPPPTNPQTEKFDPVKNDGWAIPADLRESSDMKFAMTGPDASGRLEARKAAEVLRSDTGASSDDLRAIWELSDIDKNGMLDHDEFTLAWYLATEAAAGRKPPASLPADLVPPAKREPAAAIPVSHVAYIASVPRPGATGKESAHGSGRTRRVRLSANRRVRYLFERKHSLLLYLSVVHLQKEPFQCVLCSLCS
ncbi:unnamed protein product [Ascophyllum nodosum]